MTMAGVFIGIGSVLIGLALILLMGLLEGEGEVEGEGNDQQ
jgi:hypothetical protein